MFNYTIDEFLEEAVDEKGQISEVDRKWARVQLNENFIAWAPNFKEYTCQENWLSTIIILIYNSWIFFNKKMLYLTK